MNTLLWDVFIGPSASHQQVTGGRALQKPSIDFWFLFVSKFRICPLFTEVSWNEMLGNVWSGIVTLEYTLMRCIHWAVCFSLTGGRPYKTNYLFLIFNFLSKFGICCFLMEFSWQKMFGNVLLQIVTFEYTIMRCIHWAVCFSLTGGRVPTTK